MKNVLILCSVIALLVSVGCKKKNTTPDNPDVNSRNIDSIVVAPSMSATAEASIDVDQDGVSDFSLRAINDDGTLITSLTNGRSNSPVKFVVDDALVAFGFGENARIDSIVVGPNPPRPHLNFNSYAIASRITTSTNIGHAGEGDIFMAFVININDNNHYGWIKLNVSSDGKTVKLKSLGYNIKPNAALNIGEL